MPPRVTITGLDGIPEVQPGADLAALILEGVAASGEALQDGDLLVVTHKIVSKAEGQLIDLRTIAPSDLALRHAEKWGKDARQIEVVLREAARLHLRECGSG
jgi:coenzyme F420-0:L-glutamate ligase / coenzyme F420-1:gamma-L-glutamate ligase